LNDKKLINLFFQSQYKENFFIRKVNDLNIINKIERFQKYGFDTIGSFHIQLSNNEDCLTSVDNKTVKFLPCHHKFKESSIPGKLNYSI
jgi:hypothetical protein